MLIKNEVRPQIYEDTDLKFVLFSVTNDSAEVVVEDYTKQYSGKFSLAAAVEKEVPLGDVADCLGMYIQVAYVDTAVITMRLNGSLDPIILKPPTLPIATAGSGTAYAKIYLDASITSVHITSSVDTTGIACFWGN